MATSAPQANNVLTKYKGKPTMEKPRHHMLVIIMAAEKARKGGRLSDKQFEKVTKR
jgi:hypothetical protein